MNQPKAPFVSFEPLRFKSLPKIVTILTNPVTFPPIPILEVLTYHKNDR